MKKHTKIKISIIVWLLINDQRFNNLKEEK